MKYEGIEPAYKVAIQHWYQIGSRKKMRPVLTPVGGEESAMSYPTFPLSEILGPAACKPVERPRIPEAAFYVENGQEFQGDVPRGQPGNRRIIGNPVRNPEGSQESKGGLEFEESLKTSKNHENGQKFPGDGRNHTRTTGNPAGGQEFVSSETGQ
jgi:hypothetical protein